ncbi:MAG: hypothetical protein JRI95_12120 [Deltaproteobacteria bacterium]|nr:hypothetical protein [Deltaproteobacteria bacterium]
MIPRSKLDLTNLKTYGQSCLDLAQRHLAGFQTVAEIAEAEDELNVYPHLDRLSDPKDVQVLDEQAISSKEMQRARQAVLDGRFFCEHTAAGEATRLKLGTKFLINPARDLSTKKIAAMIAAELGRVVEPDEVAGQMEVEPERLLPLSLGWRHMLQIAFEISVLAEEAGLDPAETRARQKMLIVLNEKTADQILSQFSAANFFGFDRTNVFFMVQPSFPGISLKQGRFFFEPSSLPRLHNHGQLVLQETMDDQIFYLDPSNRRVHLKAAEFAVILSELVDKISYNIEDLGYLSGAIDWSSLAMALKLGDQGYSMVMEVVANNPQRPQKGGLAAFDQVLGRNVMIESFQLKGMANKDIRYLNKNFNHFPGPKASWEALKDQGLPMPIAVKNDFLYFQPVQGDINFLVRTAFVQRRVLKPISAWKSAADTPTTINAMWIQENQPGFNDFIEKILQRLSKKSKC